MLIQFTPALRALILDMDGVLYRGNEPIGNLPAIFQHVKRLELQVMFATNTSVVTPESLVKRLKGFGLEVEQHQIITSPLATAYTMHKRWPSGGPVFIIGESGLHGELQKQGFYHAEEDVLAVVSGLDRAFDYNHMVKAVRLIMQGKPFIGTNPDLLYPTPDGPAIGSGGMLAVLEACSGVKPEVIGKPFPFLIQMALERLGINPDEALMVGDQLKTDIAAGQAAGCRTALVLTGISTAEEAETWRPAPDIVAADLESIIL